MSAVVQTRVATKQGGADSIPVCHIIKGRAVEGADIEHRGPGGVVFQMPALHLDELTWTRLEPCPASNVPVQEIIDLLEATGQAMQRDAGGHLSTALQRLCRTATLGPVLMEKLYAELPALFDPRIVRGTIDAELGGVDVLDGWREVGLPQMPRGRIRAYPPRLMHVLAGNAPVVAAMTITRCAVTKGASLFKLASNDMFTAPAILRTMADVAPDHPVVRSFSAVYWRGGDEKIESALYRSQFFDKLVAWGGDAAIRGAIKYLAPGFELISFDPKNSISMIGREAFASAETLREAAVAAAADATFYNQEACASARFQYVEGSEAEVDRFCAALQPELGVERACCTATGAPASEQLREEVEALRYLEPEYRVWGQFDGRGVVVRSSEPVDFYPEARVVNVVRVDNLADAVRWVNVSTQTVGIYPAQRRKQLADALAHAGVQQIQPLGQINKFVVGTPHDGMFPLHRFVRWVADKD